MHIKLLLAVLFVVVGGAAGFAYASTNADKIKICHATQSVKNPYVLIEVSAKALNGHDNEGDFIPSPTAEDCTNTPPPPPGGGEI